MAEPKKETVRIALPPRAEQAGSAPGVAKRDTARIVLPSRGPMTPIPRLPPKIIPAPSAEAPPDAPVVVPRRPVMAASSGASPLLQPLPKPPGIAAGGSSVATSTNGGPKKETARISVLPRPAPAPAPAINMTKTQPLLVHPAGNAAAAPVIITSKPLARVDAIPRSLCWALLGISTVIFLIQIWNYVVS
ncbi:MAG: hypothetical protein QOH01_2071 [Verrucomicrobiota bacterium]